MIQNDAADKVAYDHADTHAGNVDIGLCSDAIAVADGAIGKHDREWKI